MDLEIFAFDPNSKQEYKLGNYMFHRHQTICNALSLNEAMMDILYKTLGEIVVFMDISVDRIVLY